MGPAEILEPRRRPTQERSRRKFERLLQVSREVLLDVGFESFTCEEVAHRAELPIGTLYQFFANKYVIVCELDRLDTVGVMEEVAGMAEHLPTLEWPTLVESTVDHIADLWAREPARRAVWYAVQSTPATRATAAVNEQVLAEGVARALAPLTPGLPRERRRLIGEVIVHVTYSMLNLSVRDGRGHDEVVVELKRLLHAYLHSAEAEVATGDVDGTAPGHGPSVITT